MFGSTKLADILAFLPCFSLFRRFFSLFSDFLFSHTITSIKIEKIRLNFIKLFVYHSGKNQRQNNQNVNNGAKRTKRTKYEFYVDEI